MSRQQIVLATPWWKNKKIIISIAIAIGLVLILSIVFITASYTLHWSWTGFTSSQKLTTTAEVTQPSNAKKLTITVDDQPTKTLWDWLPLLIQLLGALAIPIVVGFGTAFFTRQQARTSEANTESQQQEELLRTYFDKISDLLLDEELSTNLNSKPNVQSIIRARTLAALHILSTERKAIIVRFLHDAGLLQYVKSYFYSLDLGHTDLSGTDLSGADLSGADLSGADLSFADLSGAKLWKSTLVDATFVGATLTTADLWEANLSDTNLSFANLSEASLSGANLSGANLSGANLGEVDLSGASLSGANFLVANLEGARISQKQLEGVKNITSKQLAQIKSSKSVATQEAKTEQASTTPASLERKPEQTSQGAGKQEFNLRA